MQAVIETAQFLVSLKRNQRGAAENDLWKQKTDCLQNARSASAYTQLVN